MRPSTRSYHDNIIDYMADCPVTKADIQAADKIFGPNLGSLKGKTVRRPNDHVLTGIDPVPIEIMEIYREVTIAIDITFVNKVPFFVTIACGIKFGTIEALANRQIPTVRDCLKKVIRLYVARGFIVTTILADNEFEPLRQWYPRLNTCAADEHVPKVERYIRTVKDRTRCTYRMLPFRHLPRLVLVHLMRNAVFWLNAFPHEDDATQKYSPRYIMMGQHLSFAKHAVIEFGAYAQTHEEHTNDMNQRTMRCICLGPTGNRQGAHWFMSLSSGERVVRYRWTELPMPREAIDRVSAIGRRQHMPSTITYVDRHGHEIGDTINELEDDVSDDDSSYLDSQRDDESMMSNFDDDSSDDDDDDSDDDSDNGDGDKNVFDGGDHQPHQVIGQHQPRDIHRDNGNEERRRDGSQDREPQERPGQSGYEPQLLDELDQDSSASQDQSVDEYPIEDPMATDEGVSGAEDDGENQGVCDGENEGSDSENEENMTEYDRFHQ
jgi:hypothetical protein